MVSRQQTTHLPAVEGLPRELLDGLVRNLLTLGLEVRLQVLIVWEKNKKTRDEARSYFHQYTGYFVGLPARVRIPSTFL